MLTKEQIQKMSMDIWQWAKENLDEIGTPTQGELSYALALMYDNIRNATYIIDNAIETIEEIRPF